MIVIDASALLAFLLRGSAEEALAERLFGSGHTLHAPHLIDIEITQVLRRYARAGEFDADRCREALADLADLPLRRYRHTPLLPRVWTLRDNVTTYDAIYVALAETLDAPLVTRDQRLAKASGHQARIELV